MASLSAPPQLGRKLIMRCNKNCLYSILGLVARGNSVVGPPGFSRHRLGNSCARKESKSLPFKWQAGWEAAACWLAMDLGLLSVSSRMKRCIKRRSMLEGTEFLLRFCQFSPTVLSRFCRFVALFIPPVLPLFCRCAATR